MTTGDFNGDGKVDLAITDQIDNSVSILLGNGSGTFQIRWSSPQVTSPLVWPQATLTEMEDWMWLSQTPQTAMFP